MDERKPRKTIELFDAVSIGIGAIVGAGIYVVLGMATRAAGPAVLLSIVLAGMVSLVTAYSFVQLGKRMPKDGGSYEFAHDLISPYGGFLTGFLWLAANAAVGAVVSLGFASYFSALTGFPAVPVAVAMCAGAVVANLFGSRHSVVINNAVVDIKLGALLLFGAAGFFFLNPANFFPFAPFGFGGVLSATALIFFAYGGFARITTFTDEVVEPAATVPRAIILALGISAIIYVMVAAAAVGVYDYRLPSSTGAFLADAVGQTPFPFGVVIISIGALAATGSVLLAVMRGISDVMAAMSRNNQLPSFLSREDEASGIPRNAVIAGGSCSALLALSGDLGLIVPISSFALLAYYAAANYSALRITEGIRRIAPFAGMFSCLLLLAYLPSESIAIGFAIAVAGTFYYVFLKSRRVQVP